MEDPEDELDIFNNLVAECIGRHGPLKRIKCTRPPAAWLKRLDIQQLLSNVIVEVSCTPNPENL